jgi:hypothetical protein
MASPTVVNELSDCFVTATYLDQNGNPYTPAAVQWRLDDLTNKVQVIAWTSIASPGISNVIDIPGASNALTVQSDSVERRQVTVKATAPGTGAIKYDNIVYDLLNIYGVP